jgi:hypothetical protein
MCVWCQVEERVYRSYEGQERKALGEICRIQEECPGESADAEDCPDRLRCLWEKKLEFVIARIQKERLALEMAGLGPCDPQESGRSKGRTLRRVPPPALSPHLLGAFERYIETLFDRLTRRTPESDSRSRGRRLIPFENPSEPSH